MLKITLLTIVCFFSNVLIAQTSIRNPKICNDHSGKFKNYFDGIFDITYNGGKFEKWSTFDSAIKFFELDRRLKLQSTHGNTPIEIVATEKGVSFSSTDTSYLINDSTAKSFSINGILFVVVGSNWQLSAKTQINNYELELDFNKFDKIWKWKMIFLNKGSSSLYTSFNSFHYAGPKSLTIQDDSLKYGTSIVNSFKSNKYIWWIKPAYYEDHKVTRLPDFEFIYSGKGVFRKSKSFGLIKTCDY